MFTTQHDRPFKLILCRNQRPPSGSSFDWKKVLDKAEQVGVYFVVDTNKRFVQRKDYWNKREQQASIK
jgi:hypothetical protein